MARQIDSSYEEVEHKKLLYKFNGEFIEEYQLESLKSFALAIIVFSFLTLLVGGIEVFSQTFASIVLFNTISMLLVVLVYSYMLINERPATAYIGAIEDARETQYNFFRKKEPVYYYARFGYAVKEFLGKDWKDANKKNLRPSNITYELLIDSSSYTTGILIPGSTGAGKTVGLMSTVFLPALTSGNGFFYIEGKGDRPITEELMGHINRLGRERDLYVFDFAASGVGGFTNSIAPLAVGSASQLMELLKSLIKIMEGENAWVSAMSVGFMNGIIKPLVILRDMDLIIKPKELEKINTLSDFDNIQKRELSFTTILDYLNFQAAIDLYYMMSRLFDDKDFMKRFNSMKAYKHIKKPKEQMGSLERFLYTSGLDVTGDMPPDPESLDDRKKSSNLNAITDWITSLEVFSSETEFGRVFNAEYSDCNIPEAIQKSKIMVTSLASLQYNQDTTGKIGKIMTAIAKNAIGSMLSEGDLQGSVAKKLKDKRLRPRKLPFGLIFDEPSNYASPSIGQLSSMVRSVGTEGGGMSIVWTGQSLSDMEKIDDNKMNEKKQLLANLGLIFSINIDDEGFQELMKKKCGKRYVWTESKSEIVKRNSDGDDVRNMTRELREYDESFFSQELRPKTGEAIMTMKGVKGATKAVAKFTPAINCEGKPNIFINHTKLMRSLAS